LENDAMTTETQAYLDGNIELADALARIAELEAEVEALEEKMEATETLEIWEKNNGPAKEYYEFFHDCFARLDGHYPCPEVTSDYDKSIIFAAISKGEEVAE
jgi:hypothetical protein